MACRIGFPAFHWGPITGILYEYHSTPLDFGHTFAFHADAKHPGLVFGLAFFFLLRTKL